MRAFIEIPLSPTIVFASLTDELLYGLDRLGLVFKPGPQGSLLEGTGAIGSVETWELIGSSPWNGIPPTGNRTW